MTRFGALSYCGTANLGDEIQTIAAEAFLPRVDRFLDRDRLDTVAGDDDYYFVILNGWFGRPTAWPPSDRIRPLFVSFYPKDPRLIGPEHREYFRRHEPIGCRNLAAVAALHRLGVEAYFSGCLTLTLENPFDVRTDDVYLVDVQPELERLIPDEVRARAHRIDHDYAPEHRRPAMAFRYGLGKVGLSTAAMREHFCAERNRIKRRLAAAHLERYATAKLVVTSRLHCALPCLALGTPVVFLFDRPERVDRLDGLHQLLPHHPTRSGRIDIDWEHPPPNPNRHLALAERLRQTCRAAVAAVDQELPQ